MTKLGPHGAGKFATFLRTRLVELAPTKTQADVAREAGFTNQNMVSMLKNGQTKLALDRVAALARALEVDPRRLYLLALDQEGHATTAREIEEIFNAIVTKNEAEWLEAIREASDHTDPALTKRARAAIYGIFGR
ncbi:helix-turn-helix domain-containing protein [Rubellimicrobium arenae]|uniref:helix-turn-helix domain-containing protein n=1 Tax=Rubellimicrobium arenae TaxID=2817372 RepID=UPI001B308BFD|nr:helix-turn-helix transcriptional regulator [Rubellimicrobium arenae]